MAAVIELQGITKAYGTNQVLKGVTARLEGGRFYALVGQNGAGKSTLMRVITRNEAFDDGSGSVLGVSFFEDTGVLGHDVAYISESTDYIVPLPLWKLFPKLARFYPRWDQSVIERALTELGLDRTRRYGQLSRGQKMQVAVAVAFATRPRIMLFDEVTAVLDARARSYFMLRAREFASQGGTLVLATNIVSEVHHIADHLLLLEDGLMKLDAPVSEIERHFAKFRRGGEQNHAIFNDADCVEIGINSDRSVSYITSAAIAAKAGVPAELHDRRRVTIEEAFIYYTKRKAGAVAR